MQSKILWKLFGCFVAVITASLLILYFYLAPTLSRFLHNYIEETLTEKAYLIRDRLDALPAEDWNQDDLDNLADRLAGETKARVTIVDQTGRVLGDSDLSGAVLSSVENHLQRPEIQQALAEDHGVSSRYSTTVGHNMMYVAVKLKRGFTRVALPLTVIDHTVFEVKRAILFSALIALLLASVVGFFLSRTLAAPLNELSQVATQIAEGDFSRRLIPSSQDELGLLTEAVNRMARSLKKQFGQLAGEKQQLMTILEGMVEGVLVTNARGEIVLLNPALKTMLSLEGECIGKTLLECLRNKDLHESIDRVLEVGQVDEQEITIPLANGERSLIVHSAPLTIRGDKRGCVSVCNDVTRIRQLEDVRREFVANVSHELKTPLTNILGYAETLRHGVDEEATARRFIEKIENNATQLKNLVEDILELSAIESGRIELHLASVSLMGLIEDLQGDFAEACKVKKIVFSAKVPESFFVQADRVALKQILGNLIDNAIKYTAEGGSVTVGSGGPGNKISVVDTGMGIAPTDLEHIFERFYRVDKARSRQAGGTGLGLAIVKHLVQAHGGEVGVTSQPGRGSEFFFTIPRKA